MNNTEEYFRESEGAGIDNNNFTNPGSGVGFDSGSDFIPPVTERSRDRNNNESNRDNSEEESENSDFDFTRPFFQPDSLTFSGSDYFDIAYYRQHNPDVAAAETGSIRHFKEFGAAEGREFRSTFDSEYYLEQNPDVAAAGVNPYLHFLQTGKDESREHRGDYISYESEYRSNKWVPNFYADEFTGIELPSINFLAAEDLINHPFYSFYSFENGLEFKTNSFDFDRNYYLEQNPDVAASGIDPYSHYLQFGKDEGRIPYADFEPSSNLAELPETNIFDFEPSSNLAGLPETNIFDFDRNYYLAENPDVAAAGIDPYLHYLRFGKDEGRIPYADFEPSSNLFELPETNSFDFDRNFI